MKVSSADFSGPIIELYWTPGIPSDLKKCLKEVIEWGGGVSSLLSSPGYPRKSPSSIFSREIETREILSGSNLQSDNVHSEKASKKANELIAEDRRAQKIIINFQLSLKEINIFSKNSIKVCNKNIKTATKRAGVDLKDGTVKQYVISMIAGISMLFLTALPVGPEGYEKETTFTHVVSTEIYHANARSKKDDFGSEIVSVLDAGEFVEVISEEVNSYKISCPNADYEFCYVAKKTHDGKSILKPVTFSKK